MANKRAYGGVVTTALSFTVSVIQVIHPEWFGNRPWVLWLSLAFLGLSLLLLLTQYAWFQRILGLTSAEAEAPSSAPSANTNTNTSTVTVNVSQPNEAELEGKIRAIASQYHTEILINGIGSDDPLIYLDLQPAQGQLKDSLVCHNRGKSTAHNIQIEPISLAGRTITFSPIAVIGPGEKGFSIPRTDAANALQSWLLHWLRQDWNEKCRVNPKLIGELEIPMRVEFSDALGIKHYTGTTALIYFPVKHRMADRLGKKERVWDFRAPQFKADFYNKA